MILRNSSYLVLRIEIRIVVAFGGVMAGGGVGISPSGEAIRPVVCIIRVSIQCFVVDETLTILVDGAVQIVAFPNLWMVLEVASLGGSAFPMSMPFNRIQRIDILVEFPPTTRILRDLGSIAPCGIQGMELPLITASAVIVTRPM